VRTPEQFVATIRKQINVTPEIYQSTFTDHTWPEMADAAWRKAVLRLVRLTAADAVTCGEFTYSPKTGMDRVFTARIVGRDQAPVSDRGPVSEVNDDDAADK